MIVLKFGGTSVQDAASMDQALGICAQALPRAPLLVSSAMAGVTNTLVSLIDNLQKGDSVAAELKVTGLEASHFQVLKQLSSGTALDGGKALLERFFADLRALVKGSLLLRDCSPRVQDSILGTGELLSTGLLWARACEKNWKALWLDARHLIVTDENFGEAAVLWPETKLRVGEGVACQAGTLVITQGFIGSTLSGVPTVLGRGGSDYSAALFGAALDAQEVQIWTDVDGIMTTDPRKVPEARSIPLITYSEAAELAFFGAKVVHPATIQPAVERQIPVLVKNTKNPTHPGTRIGKEAPGTGLRAIAGRKGITVVTVSSSRMLNAYGFLRRIFEIFDRHKVSVDLVATSEVTVSMTIEDKRDLGALVKDLEELGTVKLEVDCAILCLVGQDVWKDNQRIAGVLGAIPDGSIRLISLGASDINLSFVLSAQHLDAAVRAIHSLFFQPEEA
jgi:aspartate kinase